MMTSTNSPSMLDKLPGTFLALGLLHAFCCYFKREAIGSLRTMGYKKRANWLEETNLLGLVLFHVVVTVGATVLLAAQLLSTVSSGACKLYNAAKPFIAPGTETFDSVVAPVEETRRASALGSYSFTSNNLCSSTLNLEGPSQGLASSCGGKKTIKVTNSLLEGPVTVSLPQKTSPVLAESDVVGAEWMHDTVLVEVPVPTSSLVEEPVTVSDGVPVEVSGEWEHDTVMVEVESSVPAPAPIKKESCLRKAVFVARNDSPSDNSVHPVHHKRALDE